MILVITDFSWIASLSTALMYFLAYKICFVVVVL